MSTTLAIMAQLAGDYATVVKADSPVGYWRLGDALASTTAADSSGHANTGTVHGTVTFQQAAQQPDGDKAALFDGTSGYISTALAITTTPSFEAWVKPTGTGFFLRIFNTGNNFPFELATASGTLNFFLNFVGLTPGWIDTGATLPNGVWTYVAMTWDGTTLRVYKNGTQVYSNATWSGRVLQSGAVTIGADSSGLNSWWPGTLDDVAVYGYPLTAAQVLNHYLAGQWTDVTADLTNQSIKVSRGFQSNAPDDLVAAPASLQFGLDNSVHNSGATRSYYSPDSASKRTGWQTGILLRCQVTTNGTTRTRFWGWLETMTPKAGIYEDQTVACLAVGWLGHAATTLAAGLTAQISQRGDQLVAALQAIVPFQPPAVSFATGLDTFPYALDDLNPASSTVMDGLDSVLKSGFDRLYEKTDGTLVYENRWFREMVATNVLTLTDTAPGGQPGLALTALPAERRRDAIKNRFQVTVHPKRIDAAAVILYALQLSGSTQSIAPGATVTFGGAFVDPNLQAQQVGGFNTLISDGGSGSIVGTSGSLPTGDYAFGTLAGGTDLSGSVTVSVVYTIGDVTFTVTNHAAVPAVPSKLQCRGQGIYDYQTVTATQSDLASQRSAGQNTVTLDCPYHPDPNFAQGAAQYGLNLYASALTQLDQGVKVTVHAGDEVTLDTLLQREISDAIGITETMSGLSTGNYWINAIEEMWDERNNATFTLRLTPRDPNTYFTLDVSTLDGPDVLAAI